METDRDIFTVDSIFGRGKGIRDMTSGVVHFVLALSGCAESRGGEWDSTEDDHVWWDLISCVTSRAKKACGWDMLARSDRLCLIGSREMQVCSPRTRAGHNAIRWSILVGGRKEAGMWYGKRERERNGRGTTFICISALLRPALGGSNLH